MTLARSPWEVAADIIDPLPDPYVNDPVGWVRDELNEDLWSGQKWIANAVVDHDRVVVNLGLLEPAKPASSPACVSWLAMRPRIAAHRRASQGLPEWGEWPNRRSPD